MCYLITSLLDGLASQILLGKIPLSLEKDFERDGNNGQPCQLDATNGLIGRRHRHTTQAPVSRPAKERETLKSGEAGLGGGGGLALMSFATFVCV